jgi:AbrB family looped-hinge helix DNA binding protein
MTVTIDRLGRIVVPKAVRDRLHLTPGTNLELTADAGGIRIVPVNSEPSLVRKNGILVHHGTETTDVDIRRVIDQERANRNDYLVAEEPDDGPV